MPRQNLRKIINTKPLTLTEMQPTSQIHRSFLVYGFERVPVGQLLGRGGGKGERDRKKKGRWKEERERKEQGEIHKLKKKPL